MTRVALGNHYYAVSSDMASFAWSSGEVENVDDACLRYQYRDEYHGPVLREIHKGRISMARVKKMLRKGHLKYVPRTMRGIFSKNRWNASSWGSLWRLANRTVVAGEESGLHQKK